MSFMIKLSWSWEKENWVWLVTVRVAVWICYSKWECRCVSMHTRCCLLSLVRFHRNQESVISTIFSCQESINAFLMHMSTSLFAVLTPLDSHLIGLASTSLLLTISGVCRAGARAESFQAPVWTSYCSTLILSKLGRSLRDWFNWRYLGKKVVLSAYMYSHQGEL